MEDNNIMQQNEEPSFDAESNTFSTDKIGVEEIKKAMKTLQQYKTGKKALEEKIVKNEQWWKMRHWDEVGKAPTEPKAASGWLFNCIISKHADFMDSFPSPAILPREAGDKEEAQRLSSILPVILEQNDFETVYSDETYYKIKNGTGCYGVFWDNSKLNGLGDITVESIDLLTLFWEPGITDIQKSRNIFSVELVDNDILEESFEACKGRLHKNNDLTIKKYILDENIDTSNKSMVVDWYYKRKQNGKEVLHFCKFVDEIVLYATENDTRIPTREEMIPVTDAAGQQVIDEEGLPMLQPIEVEDGLPLSERGWFDHGLYPFVFDVLFKEEGTPVGFGFVDVCKNAQISIDSLNDAIEKSAMLNANPKYFVRGDGSVNEEELLDPKKPLVHVDGNLGVDSIRAFDKTTLDGIYVTVLNNKIEELKETSGNRDTSNGGTTAGVTAASAIAAMQEQSGKTSRDMIKTTYRAYSQVINLCIELIRQFYDENRQFRILGQNGEEEFVTYNNQGLKEQSQGEEFGVDMGYRLPVFDIKVSAQKSNAYSQLSQNEMALQFYNAGFFNPQYADQVLACLDMMEFQGKDQIIQKIQLNGGMYQQILAMQQQIMQLSQIVDRTTGSNLSGAMMGEVAAEQTPQAQTDANFGEESKHMQNARAESLASTSPR